MLNRKLARLRLEAKRVARRPFAQSLRPFRGATTPVVIHSCYHKVGTVWFLRVLREVAAHFGMSFGTGDNYQRIRAFETGEGPEVFLDYGSHVHLDELGEYVGSHMIRDPRDMVVSGYFYHLWTPETWAHFPRAEYRGMSYQEYLNSVPQEAGILEEIKRMSFWIPHMADWDYDNPRIYEIRYEDIMRDEARVLREMFQHYGFGEQAVQTSLKIANKYTFKRMKSSKNGNSHLRSGRTGEWETHFGPEQRQLFKDLYPGVVEKLGYASGAGW